MEASKIFLEESAVERIEKRTPDILSQVGSFVVTNHEHEAAGVALIRVLKDLKKEIDNTFDDAIKKAHESHKAMISAKKKHYDPLEAAEKSVRSKIIAYQDDQERLRWEEQARLEEIARKESLKRIDVASKKVAALLEKCGDIGEQIAALEAERMAEGTTEEDIAAIDSKLDLLKLKRENIERGIQQKQDEVERAAYTPLVSCIPRPAPKVEGASSTVKKKAHVVNPMALIKAVATGEVPMGVITFDMSALNKLLNAGAIVPGVACIEDRSLTVRCEKHEK